MLEGASLDSIVDTCIKKKKKNMASMCHADLFSNIFLSYFIHQTTRYVLETSQSYKRHHSIHIYDEYDLSVVTSILKPPHRKDVISSLRISKAKI